MGGYEEGEDLEKIEWRVEYDQLKIVANNKSITKNNKISAQKKNTRDLEDNYAILMWD